jgi:hypothetical protein
MRVQVAVVWRHMLGMCHTLSPHLVFICVNVDMRRIYEGVLSLQLRMCCVIMTTVNTFWSTVELILPKSVCHSALLLLCVREPILPCYSPTFILPAISTDNHMTRPRGRPRRGAPWKPHRPPLSSPDISSDDSRPRFQSVSSPANLQPPQLGSMAIIPNASIILRRLLHEPGPSQPPASNPSPGQVSQQQPSTPALEGLAPFDRAQFRDQLATLYNLVFELRQEVADLHHRVEAMEIKVANFLQILASMHDAMFPDSEEDAAEGDPVVEGGDDQHSVPSPPSKGREEELYEYTAPAAERNQEHDEHGSDDIAHFEEETGAADPPATWPSRLPGV